MKYLSLKKWIQMVRDYFNVPAPVAEHGPSYLIVINEKGDEGIYCKRCGRTSYNLNDIRYKYCGKCNRWHEDIQN